MSGVTLMCIGLREFSMSTYVRAQRKLLWYADKKTEPCRPSALISDVKERQKQEIGCCVD